MKPFNSETHTRQHLHSYCVCLRPYLYRPAEEKGVWRCAFCGGIRYRIEENRLLPREEDELTQLRRERNAALFLAFLCLAVALITAYLYDAYTEQLRDTLQSLLANRR
jgi:hypothetical protein